uniref:Ig-like domain-containing protein n=1 Tax=Myripristis murdjan TaxID=586833 RepID=A0A667XQV8_9TELE
MSPTNRVISSSSDKYQVLNDGTLVVYKAQRFDGGNYTCTARNNAGQDHRVIRVEVLVTPPVINGFRGTTNTIRVTAIRDQRKMVDCAAKGIPTPRVMWVLPGNIILPAPYYSSRMTVHSNGTLDIRSPKRTDTGQLACIARNEGGEAKLMINLDVKEVVERLTWTLPSGVILSRPQRAGRYTVLSNGTLAIQQASVYDRGSYVCRAGNEYGSSLLSVPVVVIAYPPRITNGPPSVTYAKRGVAVQLNCIAAGIPRAEPRLFGNKYLHPQGALIIQNPTQRDAGYYRCTARNAIGVDSKHSTTVHVKRPLL